MKEVYGPYDCSDGRKRVIHNGKTKLYARYLLEQKLGRELQFNEEVDHIDDDFTNDSVDNLQLLSTGDNVRKSIEPAEIFIFICLCGKEGKQYAKDVRSNRNKSRSGPYCSRRCAGKYGHPSYKAQVAEQAYATDLKSVGSSNHVGSTPTLGTN